MSQEDSLKRMSKLVNFLLARHDCGPFREPVDWRGLELYDYPKIIKKMMDLGTVKRKLERKQYATAHECAEDIRLIWKNCWTYNATGSDFWLLAKSFSRRFEDRYKKIKAEYDVGEPEEADDDDDADSADLRDSPTMSKSAGGNENTISLDAKSQLASKIFLLSGIELAHVMTMLEHSSPDALETLGSDAEVEINIDALDFKIFMEVDKYVREKVSSRHPISDELSGEDVRPIMQTTTKKRKKSS